MNKLYKFSGYKNFSVFCQVNMEKLFLPTDPPELNLLKEKATQFQNAVNGTLGGCPCNAKKRREMAMQMFKQTAIEMSRNETMKRRIGVLLNGAETVLFFAGQDAGQPKLTEKTPFSKIDTESTSTLGRTPPSNEPPTMPSK